MDCSVIEKGGLRLYEKKCPECEMKCYSTAKTTIWVCPTCGRDLSDVEEKVADNKEVQDRP